MAEATAQNIEDRMDEFSSVSVQIASPEDVRSWSYGEVKKPETINYRTYRAEKDGLFCERIFGPERDWECFCGKYKGMKHRGIICDRCGVKVTHSRERRKRMGHINLAAPVVHIWYFKAMPSRLGNLLPMKTSDLAKVIYFQEYVVIDPGPAEAEGIEEKDLISEDKYRRLKETYGDAFVADMGAEAIRELLKRLDLEQLATELREELIESGSKQRKKKIVKQLKLVEAIKDSPNKPEWMVMDVIPVIPPDLRPLVLLESGNFATSDLNDLYRRVINRNNRLKKLMDLHAPEVIIRNEKRMLQQAVDSLFDNDRTKRPVLGSSRRPLKSLTSMIKGKQGRFRENLLGKRVDYSARSVIVVGPELQLQQCGLPKKIALELFQPFIIRRLKELGYVDTIKSAKKMLERKDEEVWDILDEVIHEHPVLLNRAPTLHRMGIQAFEPVLVEGNAIKIHPLVCEAYNADFDGDQMAVHLPLSVEAMAEASILMMSTNNIFSPADGLPIIRPSLDMVLGMYYLTAETEEEPRGDGRRLKAFSDTTEALLALEEGRVDLQQPILVRLPQGTRVIDKNGERKLKPPFRVRTTPGRVKFNDIAGIGNRFYNLTIDKNAVNRLIADCHDAMGRAATIQLLDNVKQLGFREATLAGMSISAEDLQMPADKFDIIHETEEEVDKVQKNFNRGLITASERHHQITELWTHTSNTVADRVMDEIRRNRPKYEPLEQLLRAEGLADRSRVTLDARQMEAVIGRELPQAAEDRDTCWNNPAHNLLAQVIHRAGWRVREIQIAGNGRITGARIELALKDGRFEPLERLREKRGARLPALDLDRAEIEDILGDRIPEDVEVQNLYWRNVDQNPLDACIATGGWRVTRLDHDRAGRVSGCHIEQASTINPIWCMFDSGARGSAMQIRQMAGMRGLMAKPSGEIMENPIRANFREGLPVLEYFSSTHGGRKGLADTALKTAESGYLTRKLADVAQQVVISRHDCGTANGVTKSAGPEHTIADAIYGRVAAETVVDRRTDETVVEEGDMITREIANAIEGLGYDSLQVRSPMTCEAGDGICAMCYGMDLSTQQLVEEGLAVGIIAAQSIGEPGTQLTMRTFHIGGIATTRGVAQADYRADQDGVVEYENVESIEDPEGDTVVLNQNGLLVLRDEDGHEIEAYPLRIGAKLHVEPDQTVKADDVLASWDPHMSPILAEKSGRVRFVDIEEGETMRLEVDSGGSERMVIAEHKGDLHPQILVEDSQGEILGVYSIPERAYIDVQAGDKVKAGQILARTPREMGRTQDITAGLPRVTELFEARKPKDPAVISEISGEVHLGGRKRGKRKVLVEQEVGEKPPSSLSKAQLEDHLDEKLEQRFVPVELKVKKKDIPAEAVLGVANPEDIERAGLNHEMFRGPDKTGALRRFCRFSGDFGNQKVGEKNLGKCIGVYKFSLRDPNSGQSEVRYAGQTKNSFKQRINREYGVIYKKNCLEGGRHTNCRVNANIRDALSEGKTVSLQVCPLEEGLIDTAEHFMIARKNLTKNGWNEQAGDMPPRKDLETLFRRLGGTAKEFMKREHLVPQGKRLLVTTGSRVREGDPLCDGPLVPHDILRIKGEEALQNYLLSEVQSIYRFQGEEINDKHMEIIIAQMLRKVQVGEDVGDTNLLPGSIVDKFEFRQENERVVEEGGKSASASSLLLGITKASLRSESFISAASFQETTKVLTEASLAGKRDDLRGLKENVILGHMIPAGTGFPGQRNAIAKARELAEETTAAGE